MANSNMGRGTIDNKTPGQFGIQNVSSMPTNSDGSIGPRFVIPQLQIPMLNITDQEASAAQKEHRREADAQNQRLLNAIKQSRQGNDPNPNPMQVSDGHHQQLGKMPAFTIPKLRAASGEPLAERQFNIPLLNKLRSQNNSLLERGVKSLKISADDGGDAEIIDLTSTIIAVQKNAPPREAASKQRNKRSSVLEHFDIPFISCDSARNTLTSGLLSRKREHSCCESEAPVEKSSDVGKMLDLSVGYPQLRRPQVKYAATKLELLHLKLCYREDYGSNIKRFRFDTPSPDELVKEALQKSLRISRT